MGVEQTNVSSLEEREILKRRRAALKEKKRQVENAWRDWEKPIVKPGDIVALLRPSFPSDFEHETSNFAMERHDSDSFSDRMRCCAWYIDFGLKMMNKTDICSLCHLVWNFQNQRLVVRSTTSGIISSCGCLRPRYLS